MLFTPTLELRGVVDTDTKTGSEPERLNTNNDALLSNELRREWQPSSISRTRRGKAPSRLKNPSQPDAEAQATAGRTRTRPFTGVTPDPAAREATLQRQTVSSDIAFMKSDSSSSSDEDDSGAQIHNLNDKSVLRSTCRQDKTKLDIQEGHRGSIPQLWQYEGYFSNGTSLNQARQPGPAQHPSQHHHEFSFVAGGDAVSLVTSGQLRLNQEPALFLDDNEPLNLADKDSGSDQSPGGLACEEAGMASATLVTLALAERGHVRLTGSNPVGNALSRAETTGSLDSSSSMDTVILVNDKPSCGSHTVGSRASLTGLQHHYTVDLGDRGPRSTETARLLVDQTPPTPNEDGSSARIAALRAAASSNHGQPAKPNRMAPG